MFARSSRRIVAVAALGAFAGCAPVTIAPAGLSFGGTPGSWASFSQCSPLSASPEAARMGLRSPIIQAFSLRNLAMQLQSRFSSAYSGAGELASYKGIAGGGC